MPGPVDKYFKEVKEGNPSYSDAQAWATAWSIYCKHKNPGSDHCKMPTSEYLKDKSAGLVVRVAARFLEATTRTASVTPLYGHTDENSAYVVDDYPYGFKLRTQIRYWLEFAPKKGARFVSQTMDPKKGRWNAPKKSTYADLGGVMFLDGQGHVSWEGVGVYTSATKLLEFVSKFPGAHLPDLKAWSKAKVRYLDDIISGRKVWTVNGVPKPPTDDEIGRYREEMKEWEQIASHVH